MFSVSPILNQHARGPESADSASGHFRLAVLLRHSGGWRNRKCLDFDIHFDATPEYIKYKVFSVSPILNQHARGPESADSASGHFRLAVLLRHSGGWRNRKCLDFDIHFDLASLGGMSASFAASFEKYIWSAVPNSLDFFFLPIAPVAHYLHILAHLHSFELSFFCCLFTRLPIVDSTLPQSNHLDHCSHSHQK